MAVNVKYNRLNLHDSVSFPSQGNTMTLEYLADGRRVRTTAKTYGTPLLIPVSGTPMPQEPASVTEEVRDGELVFRDGRLVEVRTDGGWFSMWNDILSTTQVRPYFYVTDYLGSVRMVCDGITGEVQQSLEYLPSGHIFRSENYGMQPYKFCGKEDITMHGWNMYDSFARYQYSRFPRFTTMDPLAEWDYATSPYAYCRNDFVNLVDTWGLYWWTGEYEEGIPVYEFEAAIVYGHRRGTIVGDIYGAEFSLWCDNVNRYRSPLPGGFTTYQTYVDRYDPNLYGGGGGGNRKDNYGLITKPIEIASTIGSNYYKEQASLEYNEELETWRGKNGKTYQGLTGKGPNQYTGSRGAAQARAAEYTTKGKWLSKIGKYSSYVGVISDVCDGRYYSAGARLLTNKVIELTNGIPYVGPYVYLGLSVSEIFWGNDFYDWVQESLE